MSPKGELGERLTWDQLHPNVQAAIRRLGIDPDRADIQLVYGFRPPPPPPPQTDVDKSAAAVDSDTVVDMVCVNGVWMLPEDMS